MRQEEMTWFDLSEEITSVAMMISGLSNQLDNSETDILTPQAMRKALFGVSRHLERIAGDLDYIVQKKGGTA